MLTGFDSWKKQVDNWLEVLTGLSSDDIPDWDYASAYEQGVRPKTAAKRALAAAKRY